jgi:hypothetical protein
VTIARLRKSSASNHLIAKVAAIDPDPRASNNRSVRVFEFAQKLVDEGQQRNLEVSINEVSQFFARDGRKQDSESKIR